MRNKKGLGEPFLVLFVLPIAAGLLYGVLTNQAEKHGKTIDEGITGNGGYVYQINSVK